MGSILKRSYKAIIVGTGFGGIGMAKHLKDAGMTDFIVLERQADVGGVWRDNTYPGAACDVPSHLYSFSFAPNPNWSRVFSGQSEIHAYLKHCVHKFGLESHIQFNQEVLEARFDESAREWNITTADQQTLHCQFFISATGQLSQPVMPTIAGLQSFQGISFHSAHWDSTLSLKGKTVAVIGTGASAIQFVPAIADEVNKLLVFQRSPAYVIPRPDRAYSRLEKMIFKHVPLAMKAHRALIYSKYESRALAFTRFKGLMKFAVGRPFFKQLKKDVPAPDLQQLLTPSYQIGCKRILLSSDYLKTFTNPHVELMTQGIQTMTSKGVQTRDGKVHECDVVIYGTGFAATEFLTPMQVVGTDGVRLNDVWRTGARAYFGISVPQFPNFFMLYGPNTNLGHNSIVYMLESQMKHVMACMAELNQRQQRCIEVKQSLFDQQTNHVQSQLKNTVWNGCQSWYVDANGHNSTNWPGFTFTYRHRVVSSIRNTYSFS